MTCPEFVASAGGDHRIDQVAILHEDHCQKDCSKPRISFQDCKISRSPSARKGRQGCCHFWGSTGGVDVEGAQHEVKGNVSMAEEDISATLWF